MAALPPPTDGPDRYARLRLLGEGAMGRVWLARDAVLGREVALKEPKGGAGSASARRLEREARVLSRLDHPGIVALLDQGELADGRPFFVMRQASGLDLERWGRGEPGDPPSLLRRAWTFRGIVAAMAHAHGRGVVHRDLKPANVRVDEDGTVCVLDWGLSRLLDQPSGVVSGGDAESSDERRSLTRVGSRIGTPAWMSPEQAAGEEVGAEADVWSLGVMFWELLVGRRAYQGRAATEVLAGVLLGPPRDLRAAAPEVPEALAAVGRLALASRADRPPDAGVLLERLDEALSQLERPAPGPRPGPGPWPLVAAALAVVALASLLPGWMGQPEGESTDSVDSTELIEALMASGDRAGARAVACGRLAGHPDDPVARGALVSGLPRPQVLWSADSPRCDIGISLRWDGRALACASEGRFSLYEIDGSGLREAWSRAEEVHQVVFTGLDGVLAQAPRSSQPRRLRVQDGRPVAVVSGSLKPAVLVESRSSQVGRGLTSGRSLRETWLNTGDAMAHDGSLEIEIEEQPLDEAPAQMIVLSDGRELWLTSDAVVLRDFAGDQVQRFVVEASQGRPARMALSSPEEHVLVLTSSGRAGVLDLREGRWSSWTETQLRGAHNLAISPDGRTAAGSTAGWITVWPVDTPTLGQRLESPAYAMAFLDDEHLLAHGLSTTSLVRLAWAEEERVRLADGAVQGLAWSTVGLLARWRGGGRLWRSGGGVEELGAISDSAVRPDGGGLAVARGDGGLELWTEAGARRLDQPACQRIAWPEPDTLVCLDTSDGPYRIDVTTGSVDRSDALGGQRWMWLRASEGRVLLMDWDTRFFELDASGLHHRVTVPWANRGVLAGEGRRLLLNGRWGLVARPWLDVSSAGEDQLVVPMRSRANAFELSPDGRRIATALPTGGLRVDQLDPVRAELIAAQGWDTLRALAWSPDGEQLAVGDASGLIRLLDLRSEDCEVAADGPLGNSPPQ